MDDTLPIDDIIVDERIRRDLGDISGLANSIRTVGLLHPILITSERHLIVGLRRLRACKILGWPTIPVRVLGGTNDR